MPAEVASRKDRVLLHVLFFLSGIATVLIGQVLPILERHFSLNDLQLSYFFPVQFAGSLTGTYLTSRFARKDNYQSAATLGGILMAIGILLMNVDNFSICLSGFLVNGLGVGLTLPAVNMLILEADPQRSASALSILNFCWGLGAIVSKPFVDLSSTGENIAITTYALAIPLALTTVLLFFVNGRTRSATVHQPVDDEADDAVIWLAPMAWGIALFNFVHVGFESGMGGWLTTYTARVEGGTFLHWLSPTFLYFSFFVIGRGVAPLLFRFISENRMILIGLLIILAGMLLMLTTTSFALLGVGSLIAGFGTSWIFPTNVSRFFRVFGHAANRRATPLFICGTLGAAALTWVIGFISNATGSLRSGMYALVMCIGLLIILQLILGRRQSLMIDR
jgi:fucose permease